MWTLLTFSSLFLVINSLDIFIYNNVLASDILPVKSYSVGGGITYAPFHLAHNESTMISCQENATVFAGYLEFSFQSIFSANPAAGSKTVLVWRYYSNEPLRNEILLVFGQTLNDVKASTSLAFKNAIDGWNSFEAAGNLKADIFMSTTNYLSMIEVRFGTKPTLNKITSGYYYLKTLSTLNPPLLSDHYLGYLSGRPTLGKLPASATTADLSLYVWYLRVLPDYVQLFHNNTGMSLYGYNYGLTHYYSLVDPIASVGLDQFKFTVTARTFYDDGQYLIKNQNWTSYLGMNRCFDSFPDVNAAVQTVTCTAGRKLLPVTGAPGDTETWNLIPAAL